MSVIIIIKRHSEPAIVTLLWLLQMIMAGEESALIRRFFAALLNDGVRETLPTERHSPTLVF